MTIEMKKRYYYYLFGALLLGLLVRIPGVFWGYNFPTGWHAHHVDEWTHLVNAEVLINPRIPPRWPPHPYPKGMAAHVAAPLVGIRLLQGKLFDDLPTENEIIVCGRVVSLLYGTATILVLFLLARRLCRDPRVALLAAWILALGGLHVSQSHFFLSDVPSIFWYLLGVYFLFIELEASDKSNSLFLMMASFCFGIAFGLKLVVFTVPTLFLVTIMHKPRLNRSVQVAGLFLAGFVLVNLLSYTSYDMAKTYFKGTSNPYQFSWWSSLSLYLIEMPSIVSFPVTILTLGGSYFLLRKLFAMRSHQRFLALILVVITPMLIYLVLIVSKVSHFPRHLVTFIPWFAVISAWGLMKIIDILRLKGVRPSLVILPFLVYLAIFVYDGEKVFINEPRNQAAHWLLQNVTPDTAISWVYHGRMPVYKHSQFPNNGRPPVLVMEMHQANHYLSGMGFKNSYPRDYRFVYDGISEDTLKAFQDLFSGKTEYGEVARFKEGYFMPEYVLVDNLLGNRSRNYVAEIVIFTKKAARYSKN
jgi:hypothetical protein